MVFHLTDRGKQVHWICWVSSRKPGAVSGLWRLLLKILTSPQLRYFLLSLIFLFFLIHLFSSFHPILFSEVFSSIKVLNFWAGGRGEFCGVLWATVERLGIFPQKNALMHMPSNFAWNFSGLSDHLLRSSTLSIFHKPLKRHKQRALELKGRGDHKNFE